MKKLTALLLALVCAFSLASCDEQTNDASFKKSSAPENTTTDIDAIDDWEYLEVLSGSGYRSSWNDEYGTTTAIMNYSTARLSDDTASSYPELAKALEAEKRSVVDNIDDSFDLLCKEALEHLEFSKSEYFTPYESDDEIYVRRADSSILSLLFYSYGYYGGAHGNYAYSANNYNSETGELLTLSDVVTDIDLFAEAVEEELSVRYSKNVDYKDYIGDDISAYTEWLLDYNGITVFFSPYAIASYADGAFFVTIPYEGNESFIAPEYAEVPEAYTTEIPAYVPFYYDLDGDSDIDELTFSRSMNEDDAYQSYSLSFNGKTVKYDDSFAFDHDAILVHNADGKNYIYIVTEGESGYNDVIVHKITERGISSAGGISAGYCYNWQADSTEVLLITNPYSFKLESRADVLGTAFAYNTYSVGDDGIPVADSELFYISGTNNDDGTYSFKIKKDIEGEIVDGATGELTGNTKTLKRGETVQYYRTNINSAVDIMAKNGEIVRFEVDLDEYPYTIDGIAIEDIFDEIMWAG